MQSVRNLTRALLTGAAAALVIDVVLRNALAVVQSPSVSSLTPWWATGRVLERSVWVVAALLSWLLARPLARLTFRFWSPGFIVTRSVALDVVGRLMLALPLVWVMATWLVLATRITLARTWDVDGEMFASASLYNNAVLAYLPWAGGGAVLMALSRHAAE